MPKFASKNQLAIHLHSATTTSLQNFTLKMAHFFNSIIALVLLAAVFLMSTEARPFTDGLTSGTILSPYGGALSAGLGPQFSNYAGRFFLQTKNNQTYNIVNLIIPSFLAVNPYAGQLFILA